MGDPEPPRPLVLVADDGPGTRRVATALLVRAGCRVDAVADGRAALEAARSHDYQLVLLDLQMPVLDGIGAAAAIRRVPGPRGRVPLLALSATPRTELGRELRDFDGFLPKPLGTPALRGALARWLGRPPAADAPSRTLHRERAAPLHRDILERMRRDVGSEAATEVLDAFAREIASQLEAIGEALRERSLVGLERCGHRLRANAGSVGAERLAERAAALEAAARRHDWERASALAIQTQPLAREALHALASLQGGFAPR